LLHRIASVKTPLIYNKINNNNTSVNNWMSNTSFYFEQSEPVYAADAQKYYKDTHTLKMVLICVFKVCVRVYVCKFVCNSVKGCRLWTSSLEEVFNRDGKFKNLFRKVTPYIVFRGNRVLFIANQKSLLSICKNKYPENLQCLITM